MNRSATVLLWTILHKIWRPQRTLHASLPAYAGVIMGLHCVCTGTNLPRHS